MISYDSAEELFNRPKTSIKILCSIPRTDQQQSLSVPHDQSLSRLHLRKIYLLYEFSDLLLLLITKIIESTPSSPLTD